MFEILPQSEGNLVGVKISGKLTRADIETIIQRLEGTIEGGGPIRLLTDLSQWSGAELAALVEDLLFLFRHLKDLEVLAVIGDHAWEKWWLEMGGLLIRGRTKYFEADETEQAWNWVRTVPPRR